jgi:hypothetical protein
VLDRTRDLAVPAPDTEFRRYKNSFHAMVPPRSRTPRPGTPRFDMLDKRLICEQEVYTTFYAAPGLASGNSSLTENTLLSMSSPEKIKM